mmetsp:Transcript_36520/g.86504  ORF Transcript_36520/g.86504 Transcript_36520/m.86504 type:complete len:260 (+) Transcript_36520:432-1211(+)
MPELTTPSHPMHRVSVPPHCPHWSNSKGNGHSAVLVSTSPAGRMLLSVVYWPSLPHPPVTRGQMSPLRSTAGAGYWASEGLIRTKEMTTFVALEHRPSRVHFGFEFRVCVKASVPIELSHDAIISSTLPSSNVMVTGNAFVESVIALVSISRRQREDVIGRRESSTWRVIVDVNPTTSEVDVSAALMKNAMPFARRIDPVIGVGGMMRFPEASRERDGIGRAASGFETSNENTIVVSLTSRHCSTVASRRNRREPPISS